MLPDQRRQGGIVAWSEPALPVRQCQYFLDHQRIDVDHAVLDQVQREHADLVILAAVARHFTPAGKEHEVGRAVPLLDHVQPLVDLTTQHFVMQVAAQEDGLDCLAQLRT